MKPVLILVSEQPPASPIVGWHVVWCVSENQKNACVDEILTLPGERIVPACQALLAAVRCADNVPVAITTEPQAPLMMPGNQVENHLVSADAGLIFFPQAALLRDCIQDALRVHNPACGNITLTHLWQQAQLKDCLQ